MPDQSPCCAYCESAESVYLYATRTADGDKYSFRRCSDCEGVFLSPTPDASILAEAYSSRYYGQSPSKFIGPAERVIDYFRAARARNVAAKLHLPARVLDLGCGNGSFLSALAELGVEAHGTELPGQSANRALAKSNITVHVGKLEDSVYKNQMFDAITLWHVFEHLEAPRHTLELLSTMLKPGGRLYLSLPNPESIQAHMFKGDWLHHDPPRHLFYFGPAALRRELQALGLQSESTSFWSMEQNPFGIVQSLLNRWNPERDILYESLKGNKQFSERHGQGQLLKHWIMGLMCAPFAIVASAIESAAGRGGTMELVFIRPIDGKT